MARKRLFLRQYRSVRWVDGEPVGPGRTPGCGDVPESSGAPWMTATLFLPGVICVLAGMVGGGLKTAGVEVPVPATWSGQAATIGLGLVLVWLSFLAGDQI